MYIFNGRTAMDWLERTFFFLILCWSFLYCCCFFLSCTVHFESIHRRKCKSQVIIAASPFHGVVIVTIKVLFFLVL